MRLSSFCLCVCVCVRPPSRPSLSLLFLLYFVSCLSCVCVRFCQTGIIMSTSLNFYLWPSLSIVLRFVVWHSPYRCRSNILSNRHFTPPAYRLISMTYRMTLQSLTHWGAKNDHSEFFRFIDWKDLVLVDRWKCWIFGQHTAIQRQDKGNTKQRQVKDNTKTSQWQDQVFFTGYLSTTGLYFVSLPWAFLPPTSEIFAISQTHTGHQRLQFPPLNGTGEGYSLSLLPVLQLARLVHSCPSFWNRLPLAPPRLLPRVHSDAFYSSL